MSLVKTIEASSEEEVEMDLQWSIQKTFLVQLLTINLIPFMRKIWLVVNLTKFFWEKMIKSTFLENDFSIFQLFEMESLAKFRKYLLAKITTLYLMINKSFILGENSYHQQIQYLYLKRKKLLTKGS